MVFQHLATFYLYTLLPLPLYVLSHSLTLIQAFTIFHDCGHASFYRSASLNRAMEWMLSFMLMTPIDWTTRHASHHGRSGNLTMKSSEWNDTVWLTTKQYWELPADKRNKFRTIRNPILFFSVAPFFLWEVQYRFPWIKLNPTRQGHDRAEIINSLINTSGLLVHWLSMYYIFGGKPMLAYFLAVYVGQVWGILLFHSQHTFNPSYNVGLGWNRRDSAIKGSSVQAIPFFLKYWFMGIEYHHIHHYSTKVPGYKLQQCHEEAPEGLWAEVTCLGYSDILKSLTYTLYDEEQQKFVSFDEADRNRNKAK